MDRLAYTAGAIGNHDFDWSTDTLQARVMGMRFAALGANSYTLKPANAEQFLRTVLASTNYWLTIHQYPDHHLPPESCKR